MRHAAPATIWIVVSAALTAPLAAEDCAPDWSGLAPGGVSGWVNAMISHDDGAGPALYVAGDFTAVDGVAAENIARWDGQSWSPVGNGLGAEVTAIAVFDAGDGPRLYAAGFFSFQEGARTIAVWDGLAWSPLPGPPLAWVSSMAVSDVSGASELYVSSPVVEYIRRWDGHTWSEVGDGLESVAWDMEEFDHADGPALYAGGFFASLRAFDGAEWTTIGGEFSVNGTILALQKFDDGSGDSLFVAGEFTRVPGFIECRRVARWDGDAWSSVGDGFNAAVRSLAIFDDGSGPALFAAGDFTHSGDAPVAHVARWDGQSWEPVLAGFDAPVHALYAHAPGGAPASLIAAGDFTQAGGVPAPSIAALTSCACSPDLDAPHGSLDFSDVVAFLTAFASSHPDADFAEPFGVLDFSDVVAFLTAFAAGCP